MRYLVLMLALAVPVAASADDSTQTKKTEPKKKGKTPAEASKANEGMKVNDYPGPKSNTQKQSDAQIKEEQK
jgi:nitrous oxide reductase accessory protein NosL